MQTIAANNSKNDRLYLEFTVDRNGYIVFVEDCRNCAVNYRFNSLYEACIFYRKMYNEN